MLALVHLATAYYRQFRVETPPTVDADGERSASSGTARPSDSRRSRYRANHESAGISYPRLSQMSRPSDRIARSWGSVSDARIDSVISSVSPATADRRHRFQGRPVVVIRRGAPAVVEVIVRGGFDLREVFVDAGHEGSNLPSAQRLDRRGPPVGTRGESANQPNVVVAGTATRRTCRR
ncbi:hypothetical protein BRC82_07300 [Halobacteriales archaeon QS_1_67_19]|nr:MAG: hypothetical protein BRC82_07300 [Halobacteriales archaeon QS_1_67_19]